jgi:tetratricopeptide (TPR) repeat protein
VEDHLAACSRCRERLDQITGWGSESHVGADDEDDTDLPPRLVSSVAACLARAIPVDTVGRPRQRAGNLPTVPGYEVLAEIGRGGCGVVYRAVDRSLARTVALKLLRSGAGESLRERFRREAAAQGQLRHANIVQIFGVGEVDGQPYLALEYVAGGSLSRFTAGHPQDPKVAAALIEALARGMAAAHAAGLVHRDLKPANVLLEPRPGVGTSPTLGDFIPKVTDFGVVKSLSGDSELTDTRDFLGTPSYMAPEQTGRSVGGGRGPVVDHRADVYSLGAILYELLTGHPPFRAATAIDTLVQVAFDDPVPPSRLQTRLPRDIETVCLRCMDKDPARRYATAEALADDLARFREGRPVIARPLSWPVRAGRWCRRSPRRATAIALAVSFLLLLAIGGPLIAQREYALRREADGLRAAAVTEKDRARQHLELASKALDETVAGLVSSARMRVNGMDTVRADALRGAVSYLEDFAVREEGSTEIRARQGRAAVQLAAIHAYDGQGQRAAEEFERAITFFDRLVSQPGGTRFAGDLAGAHCEYGKFLLEFVSKTDPSAMREAERHLRTALKISDGIVADEQGETGSRDQKAIILALLVLVPPANSADRDERWQFMERSLRIRRKLATEHPDRPDLRRYATWTAYNSAMQLLQNGRFQDAVRMLNGALADELSLSSNVAGSLDGPRLKSNIEGSLGILLFQLGRREEGLSHIAEAIGVTKDAAVLFPGDAEFLAKSLLWHDAQANMFEAVKETDRAVDVRRASVALARRIIATAPAVDAHRDGLLASQLDLANLLRRLHREDAATEFAVSVSLARKLPPLPPKSDRAPSRAECFRRLAVHELSAGQPAEALVWLDRAVGLVQSDPMWSGGQFRGDIEDRRATALDRLGRKTEAAAARDKAREYRLAVTAGGLPSRTAAPTTGSD